MISLIATLTGKVVLPTVAPLMLMTGGLITENTAVPLTIVCGVSGACWYLNGRLTRIEDSIEQLRQQIQRDQRDQRDAGPNLTKQTKG